MPHLEGKSATEHLQPLYSAATKKTPGVKFTEIWSKNNLDKSFEMAKKLLLCATKLVHPDPNAPLALVRDASKLAIGAVLETLVDGYWQPLGYYSKHLSETQQRWSCFRRELFAIHQAMRHFRDETNGRHVTIFTDHEPLVSAFRSHSNNHDPVAINQLMEVSMYSNDVRYLPGRSNAVADLMSRPEGVTLGSDYQLPDPDPDFVDVPTLAALCETPTLETVSHTDLASAQLSCTEVANHRAGKHPSGVNMADVEFTPGVWLYCDTTAGKKVRPLVPKKFRKQIFDMYHMLCHPGQKPTLKKVQDRYYWPEMGKDVAKWTSECQACIKCKPHKTIRPETSHQPIMPKRFTQLMVDVIGPLPESNGYKYLLTVLCRTSRWLEALPMSEQTSSAVCNAFLQNWIPRFGIPSEIQSDNGSSFVARLWQDLNSTLGNIITFTPPNHAASLGGLERLHRDLKIGLKTALYKMADVHGNQWYSALPWTLLGRRTAFQPDLGATPAELVLGQLPKIPGDLVNVDAHERSTIPELLQKLRTNAARPPVQTAHHGTPPIFMPEDAEIAKRVYVKKGKPTKLGAMYEGPFDIVQRVGKSSLIVSVGAWADGRPRNELQHWNNCIPHKESDTEPELATKAKRGRKQLNPTAPDFEPSPSVASTKIWRPIPLPA